MSFTGDRTQLGIWALQDHRTGLDPNKRLALGAARIVDPQGDPWEGWEYWEGEGGQGSVGDVHPWTFWEGDSRGFGSYQAMFAAESQAPTGGSYGAVDAQVAILQAGGAVRPGIRSTTVTAPASGDINARPIRKSDYKGDGRYKMWALKQPSHLPLYPEGYRLVGCSGTEEGSQQSLLLPADGRIVVPQRHGPDRCGTTFCDLVATGRLGAGGRYGVAPVDAPAQTLFWIVQGKANDKLRCKEGNAVGLNATLTQQGGMSGFVPFVGKLDTRRIASDEPEAPEPPITGEGNGVPWERDPRNPDAHVGGGGGGGYGAPGSAAPPTSTSEPETAAPSAGIGVALLSHEAAGPWITGHSKDKHLHDRTKDGMPRNAAHFHVDAYWYRNREEDAPHKHELEPYPKPVQIGYPWFTGLYYDPDDFHNFLDESRPGMWRWATWVPLLGGGDNPPDEPPTETPPPTDTPVTPPPSTPDPGGPTTPGSPGAPNVPGSNTPSDPGALPPGWTPAGDGGFIDPEGGWHGSRPGSGGSGGGSGGGSTEGGGWGPRAGGQNSLTPYDHGSPRSQYVVSAPFVMGLGPTLWRGQGIQRGTADLRYKQANPEIAKGILALQPSIIRTEGMALQNASGEYQYYRMPGASRIHGGEAAATSGVWDMPAVLSVDDYYGSGPMSAITYPTVYRGFADGVHILFGLPSETQGAQDGALKLFRESSGIKIQVLASGSWGTFTPTDDDHLVNKAYADSLSGVSALDDLSDVTITAAGAGDYLRYSGAAWVDVAVSQLLTDIKTVDGAGSGLDADLLDGNEASAFAAAVHVHAASDITSGTLAHERGGLEADVSAGDGFVEIKGGATTVIKSNLSASAAPGATDDSAAGYAVGSRWIDTTADKEYVCLDATASAAVWTETTSSGSGIGGSTGSTDNAVLRADGTGGSTAQASGLAVEDPGGGAVILRPTGASNGIDIKSAGGSNAPVYISPDGTGDVVVTITGAGLLKIAATTGINAVKDEDDMASDSDTALATQQSIKAYVDAAMRPSGLRLIYPGQMGDDVNGAAGMLQVNTPAADPGKPYLTANGLGGSSLTSSRQFYTAVPPKYVPGSQTLAVRVRGYYTSASNTSDKIDVRVYKAGAGSDLCATGAQTVTGTAADYDFDITDTGFSEGDMLLVVVETIQDDSGFPPGAPSMQIDQVGLVPV